jgi:hypothetical protein
MPIRGVASICSVALFLWESPGRVTFSQLCEPRLSSHSVAHHPRLFPATDDWHCTVWRGDESRWRGLSSQQAPSTAPPRCSPDRSPLAAIRRTPWTHWEAINGESTCVGRVMSDCELMIDPDDGTYGADVKMQSARTRRYCRSSPELYGWCRLGWGTVPPGDSSTLRLLLYLLLISFCCFVVMLLWLVLMP